MRGFLVVCMVVAVALAGCADDAAPEAGLDPGADAGSFTLASGKGAISGLLVDDRFRPIDLEDTPEAESQFTGFVLLQETGEQAQSNANGEFSFVDLEPGSYTLRASIDGHEAVPQKVKVSAGEFAETSIVARRALSEGSTVLTQEYSLFAFCSFNAGVPLADACYAVDQSGDSGRAALLVDLTAVNDTATALVTEFKANQEGNYDVWMGHDMANIGGPTEYFLQQYFDGDYLKCVNRVNETSVCDRGLNSPFHLRVPLEYTWWINGDLDNEVGEPTGLPFTGVGGGVAVEGRFLLSVFLGEPDVDLDVYCVLCD